jgi:hypothetical protein
MLEANSSRHECQPVTNEWLAVKDGFSVILTYTSLLSDVLWRWLHSVRKWVIARNNKSRKKLYQFYSGSTASAVVVLHMQHTLHEPASCHSRFTRCVTSDVYQLLLLPCRRRDSSLDGDCNLE